MKTLLLKVSLDGFLEVAVDDLLGATGDLGVKDLETTFSFACC